MKTEELDFHLPEDLIAQHPTAERSASRLLHFRRQGGIIGHHVFADLPSLLRPGDLLVMNDAKVTPARFFLVKPTGGRVEGLFLSESKGGAWRVLLRNVGRVQELYTFEGAAEVGARIVGSLGKGEFELRVDSTVCAEELLGRVGRMPLPPYIRRKGEEIAEDRERYQTVYARKSGSVAAPTAGLHFTPGVLEALSERGIERAFITLDVGLGTFKPVEAEDLEGHRMHVEKYEISLAGAEAINRAKREGRRVIAVGTTATRVLESQPEGEIRPISGETGIFIKPGYGWKHINGLITNFHLPKSTLIALVAAWVGLEEQRRIYAEAIAERYRFFSYGDSSFLEGEGDVE